MAVTVTKFRSVRAGDESAAPVQPLNDIALVKVETRRETEGGLMLPDNGDPLQRERQRKGVVVAVGPGLVYAGIGRVEMPVAPGDRIIFDHQGAERVKLLENDSDGVQWFFVRERYLMGKL